MRRQRLGDGILELGRAEADDLGDRDGEGERHGDRDRDDHSNRHVDGFCHRDRDRHRHGDRLVERRSEDVEVIANAPLD